MNNYVITIARGFGSGGRQIAAKLADALQIHSYDNRIMTLASQYSGYDEHYFKEANETLNGSLITKQLLELPKMFKTKGIMSKFVSDDRLFEFQKTIIERLADTESCVIVGRCSDYILKDRDNVFSIYVEATRPYCLQRVMERMDDITEEEANELITKTDKYRSDYYTYYTGGRKWNKPTNYDLVINNARWGDEKAVQMIIQAIRIKFGEDWYQKFVLDLPQEEEQE